MNFLIQAYACSSDKGGEYAVSWGWISHLEKKVTDKDRIYVVSLTLTDQEIVNAGLKHVELIPVNGMEKFNFLKYNSLYYQIWQWKAYKMIKSLHKRIDVCHVYSLSDFRQPGYWYKLKNTISILGPVGGGQICPKSLRNYDDKIGKIREIINCFCKFNPFFKLKINRYTTIYTCNKETHKFLKNSKLLSDVPLNDMFSKLYIEPRQNKVPVIISAGRLLNKKGLLLLLDALTYIDDNIEYQLSIYGDGNQKDVLINKIIENKLQSKVFLKGKASYEEVTKVYREGDIFVLPSLRESGGSVLIEAMAHKLPLVALDMSLANILNEKKCGLFVNINQPKEDILKQFAAYLVKLIENPELRSLYGNNGYEYVNTELTWDNMINEVYGNFV